MSKSEPLLPLHVTSEDPAVRMTVVDSGLAPVAEGVRELDLKLPPGVYACRFEAGASVREQLVSLAPGSPPAHVHQERIAFSSAAPLADTRTDFSDQSDAAFRLSREVHRRLGSGGHLFLFIRDLDQRARSSPARGLTIRDAEGRLLVDVEEESSSGGDRTEHVPPWAGCTLELDPGLYRIRSSVIGGHATEQMLTVTRGWQTQVFAGRRPSQAQGRGRRPNLTGASVLMARMGDGFDPGRSDLRATDLARQGLRDRRAAVPIDDLERMVCAKWQNPMLAIYGAHLMIHQPEPDMKLLRAVAQNLHGLVGDHPDVAALDLWLAGRGVEAAQVADFAFPPMLKSSWSLVVDASAARPDLVPRGSLSAEVAESVLSGGPWLRWPVAKLRSRIKARPEPASSKVSLATTVAEVADVVQANPKAVAEQVADASPVESGVIAYAQHVAGQAEQAGTDPDSISTADVVKALKVPRTVAEDAVQSVLTRLGNS